MRRLLLILIPSLLIVWAVILLFFYRSDFETKAFGALQNVLQSRWNVQLTAEHVRWQIWPPRIEILDAEFALPEEAISVKAKRIFAYWNPSALLLGIVRLRSVEVSSPEISVDIEKARSLLPSSGKKKKRSTITSFPLVIANLRLSDGIIRLQESSTGLRLTSYDFGLQGKVDLRGPHLDLRLAFAPMEVQYQNQIHRIEMAQTELVMKKGLLEWREALIHSSWVHLEGEGRLDLGPKKTLWSRAQGSADLSILSSLYPRWGALNGKVKGEWIAEGRWGDLLSHGHVDVKGFVGKSYALDLLQTDFRFSQEKMEFHPLHATLEKGELEGKIEIEARAPHVFSASLDLRSVEFADWMRRFHVRKNRVALGVEGHVEAKGELGVPLGAPWIVEAQTELELSHFSIFKKPLGDLVSESVVEFADSQLTAQVRASSREISIDEGILRSSGAEIQWGGAIAFPNHLDLQFSSSNFDLGVAKKVGPIPLAGKGSLSGRMYGRLKDPTIEGEVDLEEFKVLEFRVGKIQGPVLYQNRQLAFPQVAVLSGTSEIVSQVYVEFANPPMVSVDVSFEKAAVSDLSYLLGGRFPLDFLEGHVEGEATGKLALSGEGKRLNGSGSFQMEQVAVYEERFENGAVELEWTEGDVKIHSARLKKGEGEVLVSGVLDREGKLDIELTSTNLNAKHSNRLQKMGLELDAPIQWSGSWKGTRQEKVLEAWVVSQPGLLNTVPFQGGKGGVHWDGKNVRLNLALEPALFQGVLTFDLDPGKRRYEVMADFQNWDVVPWTGWYRKWKKASTVATGHLSLQGGLDRWKEPDGVLELQKLILSQNGLSAQLERPAQVQWRGRNWSTVMTWIGDQTRVSVEGRSQEGDQELILKGDADLRLATLIIQGLDRSEGELHFDAQWGSKRGWHGKAAIREGFFSFGKLSQGFENVETEFDLKGDRIQIDSFRGQWGGGAVRADGFLGVDRFRLEYVDLRFDFSNVFWHHPESLTANARGKLYLSGEMDRLVLSGSIVASQGVYDERVSVSERLFEFGGGRGRGEVVRRQEKGEIQFDMAIEMDDNVVVRANGVQAELRGNANLMGDTRNVGLLGSFEIVEGRMSYRGNRFEVDSGVVDFTRETEVDPVIQTEARMVKKDRFTGTEYEVQMFVSGSLRKMPRIDFVTDPPLSEWQVTQLLLFSYVGTEAASLGAFATAEAFSLTGGLFLENFERVSRSIEESTGENFSQYVTPDRLELESSYSSRVNATNPRVTVGKTLQADLSVSYSRTIDVSGSGLSEQAATLEYRLTRSISLLGNWNNEVLRGEDPEESVGNFGADLKFGFEFE
ncbi:MAG: translocation/assembly module TamB domain-containing protein [Deltaproteobacteria bacterium]|nr:translocation/assembly module TamB domain-containing protein [Deltaproteobacteria bacterium]